MRGQEPAEFLHRLGSKITAVLDHQTFFLARAPTALGRQILPGCIFVKPSKTACVVRRTNNSFCFVHHALYPCSSSSGHRTRSGHGQAQRHRTSPTQDTDERWPWPRAFCGAQLPLRLHRAPCRFCAATSHRARLIFLLGAPRPLVIARPRRCGHSLQCCVPRAAGRCMLFGDRGTGGAWPARCLALPHPPVHVRRSAISLGLRRRIGHVLSWHLSRGDYRPDSSLLRPSRRWILVWLVVAGSCGIDDLRWQQSHFLCPGTALRGSQIRRRGTSSKGYLPSHNGTSKRSHA